MGKAEYVFSAKRLIAYAGQEGLAADGGRSFRFWADLVDSFGPSMLPFLVKGIALPTIPHGKLGLRAVEPETLVSKPGEMWVLFCYSDFVRRNVAKGSPLRADGFPLILEWRHQTADSPLLSGAFHRLADLVRKQLGVDGWGVHPAFGRYGDKIEFTDPALFSDEQDISQVASAYGALVSGLYCSIRKRYPPELTFPTLQWDLERGGTAGVAGIGAKITVAADFGARYVSVTARQARSVRTMLKELARQTSSERLRRLKVVPVADVRSPVRLAEIIAFGPFRKRRLIRALAVLSALLLGVATAFVWDSTRSVSLYYSAFVDHYGLPQGIHRLSADAAARRVSSFRFDYSGVHWGRTSHSIHRKWQLSSWLGLPRHLIRVVHVNARNVPTPIERDDFDRWPMIMKFDYSADSGNVTEISCHRRGGADLVSGPVEKVLYFRDAKDVVNGLVEEKCSIASGSGPAYGMGEMTADFSSENASLSGHSRICSSMLQRDDQGRVCRRIFCDSASETTSDRNGVGGFEYLYSEEGLVRRKTCLGRVDKDHLNQARPVSDRYGVMFTDYSHKDADLLELEYFNCQTNRTRGKGGASRLSCDLDAWGNQCRIKILDENDLPVNTRTDSCWLPICECRRDIVDGLVLTNELLMVDDLGRAKSVFYSCSKYDDRGDEIERSYLNANREPDVGASGISVESIVRDPQTGNVRRQRSFGRDGVTPAYYQTEEGFAVAGMEFEYDPEGCRKEVRCLDGDGRVMRTGVGWGIFRLDYDEGRVSQFAYYDENTNAAYNLTAGYHKVAVAYKEGNVSSLTCFGVDSSAGGKIIPACDVDRVCKYCLQYDERGRGKSLAFKNEKGELCRARSKGYCMMTRNYTPLPEDYAYGFSGSRLKDGGEMQVDRFFGPDDKTPTCDVNGCAEIRRVLDARWNCVYESAHDEKGELVAMTNSAYAACETIWDARGLVRERTYWGSNGLRATCADMLSRNMTGRVHRVVYGYDAAGRERSQRYFDVDCKPVENSEIGYHEIRTEYDACGRKRRISFWDRSNAPVKGPDGFHLQVLCYNDRGDQTEIAYFGRGGVGDRALNTRENAWKIVTEYNECGLCTCVRRMGTDGNPMPTENGCAYCKLVYDGQNRVKERVFFDANDTQAVDDANCARILYHYRQNSYDLRCVEAVADESRSIGPYYLPHVKRLVVTIDDCGHENVETVLRDGMTLCQGAVTMVSEVAADMPAAQKGVRVGDIICAVNGSDEHMFGQHNFGQELISLKNKEKTLLIARWTACGYVLHKISFDALALGISFLHGVQVPDDIFQQLEKSVRDFASRK